MTLRGQIEAYGYGDLGPEDVRKGAGGKAWVSGGHARLSSGRRRKQGVHDFVLEEESLHYIEK